MTRHPLRLAATFYRGNQKEDETVRTCYKPLPLRLASTFYLGNQKVKEGFDESVRASCRP